MRVEVVMRDVIVNSLRSSESKDERGRVQGVKRYARIVWMGGQQNILVDPSIDVIPENVPLDIIIEGDIRSAMVEMGRDKYRRDVVLPQKLVRLESKSPVGHEATKSLSKHEDSLKNSSLKTK